MRLDIRFKFQAIRCMLEALAHHKWDTVEWVVLAGSVLTAAIACIVYAALSFAE